jgi:hypothetical protein
MEDRLPYGVPRLNYDNVLEPLSFYIRDVCDKIYVRAEKGSSVLWSQPILILQNQYPVAMLNEWDGSLDVERLITVQSLHLASPQVRRILMIILSQALFLVTGRKQTQRIILLDKLVFMDSITENNLMPLKKMVLLLLVRAVWEELFLMAFMVLLAMMVELHLMMKNLELCLI